MLQFAVFDAERGEGFLLVIEKFDGRASVIGDILEKFCSFIGSIFVNADCQCKAWNSFRCLSAGLISI
jgi:hypothetical protein